MCLGAINFPLNEKVKPNYNSGFKSVYCVTKNWED